MKKAIELLLKLDNNRVNVLNQADFDELRIQQYYKHISGFLEKYLGCKAYFDRTMSKLVDDDDCLYMHNDFVHPGKHENYIVVSDGKKFIHKARFTAFIKPRTEDPEVRALPMAQREGDMNKAEVIVESQFPSYLRSIYSIEKKEDMEKAMQAELARWPTKTKSLR